MNIYTKTGDHGTTSLYDGDRLRKHSIIFNVLGELDELSSRIGMLCALISDEKEQHLDIDKKMLELFSDNNFFRRIQSKIQDINSIIATINPEKSFLNKISDEDVKDIEAWIDYIETFNPELTQFILPGSTTVDAQAQLCRTQTRKVERYLWELHFTEKENKNRDDESDIASKCVDLSTVRINHTIFSYINRLSDFFFVTARYLCLIKISEEKFYQR